MKKNIIIGLILLLCMAIFVVSDEAWVFHMDNGMFKVNASNLDNGKACSYYTSDGLVCNDTFGAGGSDKWVIDGNSLLNATNVLIVSESWVNETILNFTAISYYNVTAIDLTDGTSPDALSDLQGYNDKSYNITEDVGSPGMDVRFNFTGVEDFNQIGMRMKTIGNAQVVNVYLWDYGNSDWEEYWTYTSIDGFTTIVLSVFDSSDHLSGGLVQLLVNHTSAGNINHVHLFDWITLIDGASTFSTSEVDPRSFHVGENMDLGDFNFTVGGGYGGGGVTIYDSGSISLASDLLIDGDILTVTTLGTNGSIIPTSTNIYNLGNSSNRWGSVYTSNINGVDNTDRINFGTSGQLDLITSNNLRVSVRDTEVFISKPLNLTTSFGGAGDLITLIDFGNVTISANSTHFCMVGESKICIET